MRRYHLELLLQQLLRLLVHATTWMNVDELLGVGLVSVPGEVSEDAPEDQGLRFLLLVVEPQEAARELLLCD